MSQKGTRKSQATVSEDKEKGTESPVKEMKKKMAANAEKEKQPTVAAHKSDKGAEKSDKTTEKAEKAAEKSDKVTEKTLPDKDKSAHKSVEHKNVPTPDKTKTDKNAHNADRGAEKTDKTAEKADKTAEKADKTTDKADKVEKKTEKPAEKKTEKPIEHKNEQAEKKDEAKGDASGKVECHKPKQNGRQNGVDNGVDTVSERDSSDEELALIIDEHERDETFPELVYDDTSDPEPEGGADADADSGAPSRSYTRRSQVKVTKTPETPRPLSVKEDDPKESRAGKAADPLATDRKLRSSDSPKPDSKKEQQKKESPRKEDDTIDLTEDDKTANAKENGESHVKGKNKLEMDVTVEIEMEVEPRSGAGVRTRARVSPYTRANRLDAHAHAHDQTASSLMANYTGNNTTLEMDITETSSLVEETAPEESPYLRGLRTIRGRTSYKPLKELSFKHTLNRSVRSNTSVNVSLESARPTGTVVGRKRKPDEPLELAEEALAPLTPTPAPAAPAPAPAPAHAHAPAPAHRAPTKRMRLFDSMSVPFRGFSTRSAAQIVGINTDLPLSAPVASTSTFDPERLKGESFAEPLGEPRARHADSKRCILM